MNALKKILEIVPLAYKNRLYLFTFLTLISSSLDLLGIGLIFPLLNYLINMNTGIIFIDNYVNSLNLNFSEITLIIFLGLIIVFILKNILLVYIQIFQTKFTSELSLKLSKELFNHYLSMPIKFHLSTNSAKLLRNTRDEIFIFVNYILNNILYVITDLILFLLFTLLLFYISTVETIIIILIFSLISFIIYAVTKRKIFNVGKIRLEISEKIFKFLKEGFSSIREIKIYDIKNYFVNRYEKEGKKAIPINIFINFISIIPKVVFEILTIIILVSIIFYASRMQIDFTQMIPILGIYVLAIYRMAPSMIRVLQNVQKIKHYMPSFHSIYSIYHQNIDQLNTYDIDIEKNSNSEFKKFEFKNVSFEYENNIKILENLDLNILSKSKILINGKSGCGKSTLLDLLCGFINPSEGEIWINEKLATIKDKKNLLSYLSYVSQSPFFIDNSLIANIALGKDDEINHDKVIKILQIVELNEFSQKVKNGQNPEIGEGGLLLSGGQRQRIAIARALYFDPKILILDEATNAIDYDTEIKILENINNKYKDLTIIKVSHSTFDFKNLFSKYKFENKKLVKYT